MTSLHPKGLALILVLAVSTFSQVYSPAVAAKINKRLHSAPLCLPRKITAPGKMKSGTPATGLTSIVIFRYSQGEWILQDSAAVFHDAESRIEAFVMFDSAGNSVGNSYEYIGENHIRETIGYIVGSGDAGEVPGIIFDYYYSEKTSRNIMYEFSTMLTHIDILLNNVIHPIVDSMEADFGTLGGDILPAKMKVRYAYDNASIVAYTEMYSTEDTLDSTSIAHYRFSFDEQDRPDSIAKFRIAENAEEEEPAGFVRYQYDGDRIATIVEDYSSGGEPGTIWDRTDVFYNPDGAVDSVINSTEIIASDTVLPNEKIVYHYGDILRGENRRPLNLAASRGVSVSVAHGKVTLFASDDAWVRSVALFDLQGRVVEQYVVGEVPFVVPVTLSEAVGILAVGTDNGTVTFKVSGLLHE